MKSFVIAFRHGSSVPKYGCKLNNEQILRHMSISWAHSKSAARQDLPRNKEQCLQCKYVKRCVGSDAMVGTQSDHPRNEEGDSHRDDTQVPDRPEIRGVEGKSSVTKLDKLYTHD
jgi:hypothetical protein